jgi:hypothetical protein
MHLELDDETLRMIDELVVLKGIDREAVILEAVKERLAKIYAEKARAGSPK